MTPPGSAPEGLPPVLVVSPQAADAAVLCEMIDLTGLDSELVTDPAQIVERAEDLGCLVLTQEALKPEMVAAVSRALGLQPSWSELPIMVLASAQADTTRLRDTLITEWRAGNFVLLSRPLRTVELLSAIQLALSARMRQFRIRDQLRQELELRRELNHRVKNILATVQAISDMTRRAATSPEDAWENFSSRLGALAAVHSTLHESAGDGASFCDLAGNVLRPYLDASGDRVRIRGSAHPIAPEAAKLIGLCLHELATNAMKYGALSTHAGTVEVGLDWDGPGHSASFLWREKGGPEVRRPERAGYGATFVTSALSSVFGAAAKAEYAPEGFCLVAEGAARTLSKA